MPSASASIIGAAAAGGSALTPKPPSAPPKQQPPPPVFFAPSYPVMPPPGVAHTPMMMQTPMQQQAPPHFFYGPQPTGTPLQQQQAPVFVSGQPLAPNAAFAPSYYYNAGQGAGATGVMYATQPSTGYPFQQPGMAPQYAYMGQPPSSGGSMPLPAAGVAVAGGAPPSAQQPPSAQLAFVGAPVVGAASAHPLKAPTPQQGDAARSLTSTV